MEHQETKKGRKILLAKLNYIPSDDGFSNGTGMWLAKGGNSKFYDEQDILYHMYSICQKPQFELLWCSERAECRASLKNITTKTEVSTAKR